MAAPAGVPKGRWGQVVRAVSQEMAWTTAQADAWLNDVWDGLPFDEVAGDLLAGSRLRAWAETNVTGPTLPAALRSFLT